MAQTFLNTGTQAGNFEDLVDFINRISNEETPFMSKIGTTKAKAIKHEWMTQATRAGASNNRAEGFTISPGATDITVRVRRSNQLQIIAQPFSVSNTQEEVDKAGLGQSSEYENQKMLKFVEIKKDADFELIRSTTVTRDADAGTAGEMDGLLVWPTGGNAISAGGTILSQDLYNKLTQAIAEASGQSTDTILCAGTQRRIISTWTTAFKEHQMKDTTMTDTVEAYRGDYGTQMVMFDIQMATDQICAFKSSVLKKAMLRPAFHKEIGQITHGRQGYVGTELTLEVQNPNAVGKITSLLVPA